MVFSSGSAPQPTGGRVLFEFDADQRLLQETVREVVAKECPPALVRGCAEQAAGTGIGAAALWRVYTDLGWTELTEPAEAVELAIVLEELGRACDPTPFLATTTQFSPLAPGVGGPERPGAAVLSGVRARPDGAGWRLDGTAQHVLDGDRAERLAVVTGAGVFVVPAAAVATRREAAFDPVLHLAEVRFADVAVSVADRTAADPERASQVALTGMALTVVGACRRILELALEHARPRHQFGAPIGSFQAVQHMAADMHVAIERARALALFAALTIAEDDPRRERAAAMAKAAAGECQTLVFRNGLQM